jgi:anti-repressor protein
MNEIATVQHSMYSKLLNGEKVDARTLWENLESRQDFSNWIKNRLADFIEETDYTSFDKIIERETGATRRKDYLLTINTAKHICLIERNEAGRRIRQYLIDVEQKYREINSDPAYQMAQGLLAAQKLLEVKNARIAELEPKAEILDRITATENDVSVRGLASILAQPHLGQNALFKKLREDGYIDGFNHPYRQYIESGIMYEKEYYVPGLEATKQQLRITQKGVAYFARKYGRKETA